MSSAKDAARLLGSLGGKASAAKLSPKKRRERASAAGKASAAKLSKEQRQDRARKAVAARWARRPPEVVSVNRGVDLLGHPRRRLVARGHVRSVRLTHPRTPVWALVHESTIEPGRWQLTWMDDRGAVGDTRRDTLQDVLDLQDLIGYEVAEVR